MRIFALPIRAFVVLGLAVITCVHGETAELIHFQSPSQTVTATPEAKNVIATYHFTNVSANPLAISSIESPCGCISAHWEQRAYHAGESGDLMIVLGIGEQSGHLAKQILIKTEPTTDQPVTLTLNADIPPGARLSSQVLTWIAGSPGVSQEVTVMLPPDSTYEFRGAKSRSIDFEAVLVETIEPRCRVLRVTPKMNTAIGSAIIEVETNHRTYQVFAQVVDPAPHSAP